MDTRKDSTLHLTGLDLRTFGLLRRIKLLGFADEFLGLFILFLSYKPLRELGASLCLILVAVHLVRRDDSSQLNSQTVTVTGQNGK